MMSTRGCITAVVVLAISSAPGFSQVPVNFGTGINSATGGLRSLCVSFTPPADRGPNAEPFPTFAGKSFQYKYSAVENMDELRESLEVNANSSIRGLWGSGSAAASYLKSVQVNQYDLTMLVQGRILGETVAIEATRNDSAITAGGRKLTPQQIFLKCGDEFVSGLQYGGTIYGIVVVNTRSRAEKERLSVELSGSFRAGVEVNAQAQHAVERILRNNSYHMNFYQEGGNESSPPPEKAGIGAFFEWAHRTEKAILSHPTIMQVERKPLSSVYPEIRLVTAANQRDVLRRLASLSAGAETRQRNLSFVTRNLHRFPAANGETVRSALDAVADLLKEVAYLADDCYRDETLCSKQKFQQLASTWAQANTPLPKEDPLYGVFDFATFEPAPRGYGRRTRCPEKWDWALRLGGVEITTENTRLNYYFTCDRTGYCYDCGGGWDCKSPDPRPTWTGKVTAELQVTGDVVNVKNVVSPNNSYDAGCEAPLMEFIRSRDGARVR